ncbi:karyopherin alpha [Stylonychia lemnae]|uniref:Importin subunit alpha n=1 Tax=Stylonychia lemnae TaxID=5949 RepID=A0A078AJ93_STYLE|nr:karyopherin alpha [Stylonychia lemnae]|eukprot:CDW81557.1 karyopherin alpha [Stylonychia lemnae]
MDDSRTEERKNFMKPTYQDPLKKREQFAVSLRKQKTNDIIVAKRRRCFDKNAESDYKESEQYRGFREFDQKPEEYERRLNDLIPELFTVAKDESLAQKIQLLLNKLVTNQDYSTLEQLTIITCIRRFISSSQEPPIDEILQTNILDILCTVFKFNDGPEDIRMMKLETVWILTNLAHGQSDVIEPIFYPKYGFIGSINHLMKQNDSAMIEQCFWFIGNSLAENEKLRNLFLNETELIDVMYGQIMKQKISKTLFKTLIWLTSNISRPKNLDESVVLKCLAIAEQGLFLDEEEILSDALWTISYLCDTQNDNVIDKAAKQQNIARICQCLAEKEIYVYVPALRCIGNMLTSNDSQITDICLWEGVIDRLTSLLFSTNSNLIKESLWALSNITAGTQPQVDKFVDSPAFDRVLALAKSQNIDHKRESLFVLCNAITGADFVLRKRILERGADLMMSTLISGLYLQDQKILKNLMEAFDCLLDLDRFYDWKQKDISVAHMFEVNDGLNALNEVQKHPARIIYEQAYHLLESYFQEEEDQDRMDDAVGQGFNRDGQFNI